MVNLKPVVPGHVLICPKRHVEKVKDLSMDETMELFGCAQEIAKAFGEAMSVDNFTYTI